jgi:hypothetical protein
MVLDQLDSSIPSVCGINQRPAELLGGIGQQAVAVRSRHKVMKG